MGGAAATWWDGVTQWYLRHHYAALFVSLLLTLVVVPVTGELQLRVSFVEGFLFLNLMMAVVGAGTWAKPSRRLALVLTMLMLVGVLRLTGSWLHSGAVSDGATALWVVMAAVGAFQAVRFAMGGRVVDAEHVYAALSAYLLAGHMFGAVYWKIGASLPGSFALAGATAGPLNLESAIYYSFVTLATLGYGDIVPVAPVARGFAVTEAILGQLYLAVLVARLIGVLGRKD